MSISSCSRCVTNISQSFQPTNHKCIKTTATVMAIIAIAASVIGLLAMIGVYFPHTSLNIIIGSELGKIGSAALLGGGVALAIISISIANSLST